MNRIFKVIATGVLLLCIAIFILNAGVFVFSKPHVYEDISEVPSAHTVIVPGAAVYDDGSLSSVFIDRIHMGLSLYQAQKVSRILLSGDNSTETYNEVNPARLYLISRGVPDADIFMDHAGFDTYSTMYRARDIFAVPSAIIATQEFHLPRAVFIARSLGMDAHGMKADRGKILFRNHIREALAIEKAILDLLFGRTPKFLGEKIPITWEENVLEVEKAESSP